MSNPYAPPASDSALDRPSRPLAVWLIAPAEAAAALPDFVYSVMAALAWIPISSVGEFAPLADVLDPLFVIAQLVTSGLALAAAIALFRLRPVALRLFEAQIPATLGLVVYTIRDAVTRDLLVDSASIAFSSAIYVYARHLRARGVLR